MSKEFLIEGNSALAHLNSSNLV